MQIEDLETIFPHYKTPLVHLLITSPLEETEREKKHGEIHGVDCGSSTCFSSGSAGAGSDGEEVFSWRQKVLESRHQL